MSQLNKTVIEDINDLLFDSNEELATKIYMSYVDKVEAKAFIMEVLTNCMKHDHETNMSDVAYRSLLHEIDNYIDIESRGSGAETEAIKHWVKYSNVDVKYSLEAITNDISDVYHGFKSILGKYHISHYCDADNYIEYMPSSGIYLVAIECMIEGTREGITGKEYFDKKTKAIIIATAIKDRFNEIFSRENYYKETCELIPLVSAMERFFANDSVVDEKVRKAKEYDKKGFVRQLKEADVLVLYRQLKFVPFIGKLTNKISQFVTGTSFMSIKLVGKNCKTVIGFGAKIGTDVSATKCNEVPIEYIMDTCAGIVAIRHKDIKPKHVSYILDYARRVMLYNSEYSFIDIIKTAFTHKTEATNGPVKLLSKEEAKTYYAPMICTTLITAGYRGAGLDPGVNFSDKTAWPIDVLKSSKFDVIASYFIPDEKPLLMSK